MADETIANPLPIRTPRKIRTHTARISTDVEMLDQSGAVIGTESYGIDLDNPALTTLQRDYLIEAVRRICILSGRI